MYYGLMIACGWVGGGCWKQNLEHCVCYVSRHTATQLQPQSYRLKCDEDNE